MSQNLRYAQLKTLWRKGKLIGQRKIDKGIVPKGQRPYPEKEKATFKPNQH